MLQEFRLSPLWQATTAGLDFLCIWRQAVDFWLGYSYLRG